MLVSPLIAGSGVARSGSRHIDRPQFDECKPLLTGGVFVLRDYATLAKRVDLKSTVEGFDTLIPYAPDPDWQGRGLQSR